MIDPLVLLGIGLAAPAVLAVATPAAGATILVVAASQPPAPFSGRTAWARSLEAPLREFLRTETGGAAVLLAAAIAALVWVNVDGSSYGSVWDTTLSIDLGGSRLELSLREAKIGILGAALGASIVTWLLFRITALLPSRLMHHSRRSRHRPRRPWRRAAPVRAGP